MIRATGSAVTLVLAVLAGLCATNADARRIRTPAAAPALARTPAAPPAAQPPIGYPQALILIRSALAGVEQANEAGDYNVLYATGAKGFQHTNPPARLAQIFSPLRPYNLNSVLVLEPQFTQQPTLTANGMMSMAGYFTSGGYHINFQLIYAPEDKRWKLFGVSVGVEPAR